MELAVSTLVNYRAPRPMTIIDPILWRMRGYRKVAMDANGEGEHFIYA